MRFLTKTVLGLLFTLLSASVSWADTVTLDENCTVSILNRTVQVAPDGSWSMPNVPANLGQIRARVTCIQDGQTVSGQTEYFNVVNNGITNTGPFFFEQLDPIPSSLTVVPGGASILNGLGSTLQLAVTANYLDGSNQDVTAATSGINYSSTNPAIASVSADGLITAVASGNSLISAGKDGAVIVKQITVVTTGDSDLDGLPDDYEIDNGLNPNDPVDAAEDQDKDGLSALEEFNLGTDPQQKDSDGDGVPDGEEIIAGEDGFITDPLNPDTDNDGLSDGLEAQIGTDPTDASDKNIGAALSSIEVTPVNPSLVFNTIDTEASLQLIVTGNLIDGGTIDLTSTILGTNYSTSDINIISFGATSGEVFAGQSGVATVTVENSGHQDSTRITVTSFTPVAQSSVSIPGYANNVDVAGDYAFVAAGIEGLQVVDISDTLNPQVVAEQDTSGIAIDIKIKGNLAYIADGPSGLNIMEVSDPRFPTNVSSVDTPDIAQDLVVNGNYAYIADGDSGLQIVDVSNPFNPQLMSSLGGLGTAKGLDLSGNLIIIVAGSSLHVIDVQNKALPLLLGSVNVGDVKDVVVEGNFAYVAAYNTGYRVVDFNNRGNPIVVSGTGQFVPRDVALADDKAFFAEQLFPNVIAYVNIADPANSVFQGTIDLSSLGDYAGTGIALNETHAFVTEENFVVTNDYGSSGNTRLFIAQYRFITDNGTTPPTVDITQPVNGGVLIEGETINVEVNAIDDVHVASVTLLVDGDPFGSDVNEPFDFNFTVPDGVNGLTFDAEASDLASNIGFSDPVVVSVIPDPLTTVIGQVIDENGNPVANADVVTLNDLSAITSGAGEFTIPSVPTILGDIFVSAEADINGEIATGQSDATPFVRGGVTDVGQIEVKTGAIVGYYDLSRNTGNANQVESIAITGFDAVDVGDLNNADLEQFNILFVQNPSNGGFSSTYQNNLQKIFDFVENGGVLIFHDRAVSNAQSVLPGQPGQFFRDFADSRNIEIVDNSTEVTDGPGGIITNASLDNGNHSTHGYIPADSVPLGATGILSRGNANELITYSYPHGAGAVIYSTIPLDFYLSSGGALGINMKNYAANVIKYANTIR